MEEKNNNFNKKNPQQYINDMKKLGFWGGFKLGLETGYELRTYINPNLIQKDKSFLENGVPSESSMSDAQEINPQGPCINIKYNF